MTHLQRYGCLVPQWEIFIFQKAENVDDEKTYEEDGEQTQIL